MRDGYATLAVADRSWLGRAMVVWDAPRRLKVEEVKGFFFI
jgi:hypothetical protein